MYTNFQVWYVKIITSYRFHTTNCGGKMNKPKIYNRSNKSLNHKLSN